MNALRFLLAELSFLIRKHSCLSYLSYINDKKLKPTKVYLLVSYLKDGSSELYITMMLFNNYESTLPALWIFM